MNEIGFRNFRRFKELESLPFGGINFSTMESQDMTGMNEILRNIEYAKTDPNIKGIY